MRNIDVWFARRGAASEVRLDLYERGGGSALEALIRPLFSLCPLHKARALLTGSSWLAVPAQPLP
jgi:hypothetical protein